LIYLMTSDGSFLVVHDATSARIEGERLVCRGPDNVVIAHFARLRVILFSPSSRAGQLMLEASDAIKAIEQGQSSSIEVAMNFLRQARGLAPAVVHNARSTIAATADALSPESEALPTA
jgi:hypothetical protein